MFWPSLAKLMKLAAALEVLDQETKTIVQFEPKPEQIEVLKLALRTKRLCIGKGRQVGCSTILVFLMMVLCIMNPGLTCAIVADDQDKANGLLAKIKRWLKQLGFHRLETNNVESIELANGSSIDALSAISTAEEGESRVGRSKPYAIVLCTEQSFWRNARAVWAALTGTMPLVIWDESTGAPGDTLFREIYEGDGWDTYFIGVEQDPAYKADPEAISDEVWAYLVEEYQFTDRATAAWWHSKMHTDKLDASRMLREFPVVPQHMWTFREGLHLRTWVEAKVRVDAELNYYAEPEERDGDSDWFGEPVVMGVDTALGLGLDASAFALIGHRSGQVKMTWRSNTTPLAAYRAAVDAAVRRFTPVAVVVESNGCGSELWQHCAATHANAYEQKSGNIKGEVFDRRDQLREAIESGQLTIGGDLLDDAKGSTIKAKRTADGQVRAVFEGRDDVLSAVSFARKWREQNPYRPPKPESMNRDVYDISARLKAKTKVQATY